MKVAKVFPNGQSQAIRLPKEFRVDTDEVYIEKIGHSIMILRKEKNPWDIMRKAVVSLDELDIPREQPPLQSRELF